MKNAFASGPVLESLFAMSISKRAPTPMSASSAQMAWTPNFWAPAVEETSTDNTSAARRLLSFFIVAPNEVGGSGGRAGEVMMGSTHSVKAQVREFAPL